MKPARRTMVEHVGANRDAWICRTYWASDPWWDDDHPFSIEPTSLEPRAREQIAALRRYFE